MYRVDVITPPQKFPVELAEAKATARVLQEAEDQQLDKWLKALTLTVQELTDRQALEAELEVVMDSWNDPTRPNPGVSGRIELRPAPLRSVTSVKYIDAAGVEQTLDAGEYIVSAPAGPTCEAGAVILKPERTWPSLQAGRLEAVRIRFKAGYGLDTDAGRAEVPQGFKDMISAAFTEKYQMREAADLARALEPGLAEFRLWR